VLDLTVALSLVSVSALTLAWHFYRTTQELRVGAAEDIKVVREMSKALFHLADVIVTANRDGVPPAIDSETQRVMAYSEDLVRRAKQERHREEE
jgi:hypothetical protein